MLPCHTPTHTHTRTLARKYKQSHIHMQHCDFFFFPSCITISVKNTRSHWKHIILYYSQVHNVKPPGPKITAAAVLPSVWGHLADTEERWLTRSHERTHTLIQTLTICCLRLCGNAVFAALCEFAHRTVKQAEALKQQQREKKKKKPSQAAALVV